MLELQTTQVPSLSGADPLEEGVVTPLQYSSLENPMGREAWWATVHGVTKSWTRLSDLARMQAYHPLWGLLKVTLTDISLDWSILPHHWSPAPMLWPSPVLQCLLNLSCLPGTVLGPGDSMGNKTGHRPLGGPD